MLPNNTLFIIDIDATCVNATDRFAKAGKEPSRNDRAVYDAWVRNVQNEQSLMEDMPVPGMQALLDALAFVHSSTTFYLTSREEKWRKVTEDWLEIQCFPSLGLVMRDNGDYDESAVFKEKHIKTLKQLCKATEVIVFDDDPNGTIQKMCAKNGWTFLKALSGGTGE